MEKNMKQYALIPVIALLALSGCSQSLNAQDRALLTETHSMAEQAKNEAAQAALDAKAAREDAAKAAAAAQAASEKSDRIFQQGQTK
jgi:hypothetical protein